MPKKTLVKSVCKAVDILSVLALRNKEISFTEIRTRLELDKSTAHRFLSTLEHLKLVRRHPETGYYTLGIALLHLGSVAGNQIELKLEMKPYLQELVNYTGETSNLVILDEARPVFIDAVEGPHALRMFSRIGRRTYLHSTSVGKTLLAYQSSNSRESILYQYDFIKLTNRTITAKKQFLKELKLVRSRGYAIDNEESADGAVCIGAPVFDRLNQIVAAISISGPKSRIKEADFKRLGTTVKNIADNSSAALGNQNNRQ